MKYPSLHLGHSKRGISLPLGLLMSFIFFSTDAIAGPCDEISLEISANSTSICVGGALDLNLEITGLGSNQDVSYAWSGPNNYNSTSDNPNQFNVVAASEGLYTVTATIDGCSDPLVASIFIDVRPSPATPVFNLPRTGCPGLQIPISGFTPTNGVNYAWSVSNNGATISGGSTSSPSAVFQNGGNYGVSVTAILNGCSVTSAVDNISITELSLNSPDVSINSNFLPPNNFNGVQTFTLCDGTASGLVEISNYAPLNNDPTTNYFFQWNNSATVPFDATMSEPIVIGDNFFTLSANYNGCSVIEEFNLYVGSNPYVAIGVGSSTNLCPGQSVTANITPVNQQGQLNSPGTTYELYFSNNPGVVVQTFLDINSTTAALPYFFNESSCGAGANNPCFPAQDNVFYAYVVATNACANSCASSPAITYNSPPEAAFTVSNPVICQGTSLTITNTGEQGNTTIGSATTGYTCSSTTKLKYTISPNTGYTVTSGSLGGNSANYNNWNGTDVVVLAFSTPGNYTITQNAQSNACGVNDSTTTICVAALPDASFTVAPQNGCAPLSIDVNNTSNNGGCSVIRTWTSAQTAAGCSPQPGAPTIANSDSVDPSIVYEEGGVYSLTLTLSNVCGTDTHTQTGITVHQKPEITLPNLGPICIQESINPVADFRNCNESIDGYSWTFTGGTPSTSVAAVPGAVDYVSPGDFNVSVSATNACGTTTVSTPLVVSDVPNVTLSNDSTICRGSQVQLNSIVSGGASGYTYSWSPSAGLNSSIASNVLANPIDTIEYFLEVTDAVGCSDVDSVTINVNQPVTALVNDTVTCIGNPITLNAITNSQGFWTQPVPSVGTFSNVNLSSSTFTPFPNTIGNVTLRWTTLDPAGPCPLVFDEGVLTIVPPPQASFTADFEACGNLAVPISVNTNTPGSWSSNGSGSFSPSGIFNPVINPNSTYTPATADIGDTLNIVWTTIDPSGPCPSVFADTTLIVYQAPTADAGGPYQTCGRDSVPIQAIASGPGHWSAPANSGFFVNPTSANTHFIPASAVAGFIDLMWTTADPDSIGPNGPDGPCSGITDVATLQVFAPAFATATNYDACEGTGVVIQVNSTPVSGTWSSNGIGSFSSSPPISNTITYLPPNDTNAVQLTWTTTDPTGPCPAFDTTIVVSIFERVEATIDDLPYTICGLNAADISVISDSSGIWSTVPPGQGLIANPNSNATTFTPPSAISSSYTLIWTSEDPVGPCPAVVVDTVLQVFGPATASISAPQAICDNEELDLSVSLTNANQGAWTTNNGNGVIVGNLNLNASYTVSELDLSLPSGVEFIFTTVDPDLAPNGDDGPCESVSDTVSVIVIRHLMLLRELIQPYAAVEHYRC